MSLYMPMKDGDIKKNNWWFRKCEANNSLFVVIKEKRVYCTVLFDDGTLTDDLHKKLSYKGIFNKECYEAFKRCERWRKKPYLMSNSPDRVRIINVPISYSNILAGEICDAADRAIAREID